MKIASLIFAILIFVNGILLSFQYHVFSTNSNKEEKAYSYSQDIEVTHKGSNLLVKQTFSGLPERQMHIIWPEASKKKSCSKDETTKNECNRLEKNLNSFKAGQTSKQSISYKIALSKKGIQSGKMYTDLFATLKQGIPNSTSLQIVDENRKGGHWVTGLPKIGEKSLTLVDYSYFKGNGGVYELYWTKKPIKKSFDSRELTVYSNKKIQSNLKKAVSSISMLNSGHIDIVESNRKSNGSRVIFTNTLTKKELQKEVAISQIKEKYQFQAGSILIPNLVASFATGENIGGDKSKEMVRTLNEYFSTDQKNAWKTGLSELEGKAVDSSILDKLLSQTLDSKTSFFQMNEANKKEVVPLIFEETRELYINDQKIDDVKIILKDGEILYAANPMLGHLGYTTNIGKNGYYVKNKFRTLRFPGESHDFYVDDHSRVNFNGNGPIVKFGGTYYIEESWLIRIFQLDYQSLDDRINLTERK